MKSLGLLSINEVNVELIKKYINASPGLYPNIERLIEHGITTTTSETKYDLLEPWVQWPSIQTCEDYNKHKIFRLGDILKYSGKQIYEVIEDLGVSVGAVSPMNAENRLRKPSYFIPDPWTKTSCSGSFLIKRLYKAIAQAVGDNASSKISIFSKIFILIGLLRYSRLSVYPMYWSVVKNTKNTPGSKALILDILLNEVHSSLFRSFKPGFTQLFLNSFAHIQHHYMLSSSTDIIKPELKSILKTDGRLTADPFPQAIKVYDWIIGDFISTLDNQVIVATGLSQVPYDRLKYYYRLQDHSNFLQNVLNIRHASVNVLMTRDFVINFSSEQQARDAELILKSVKVKGTKTKLFGEVQNRGNSLFVTLTYGEYINNKTEIIFANDEAVCGLKKHVVFVALKNGMHCGDGYCVATDKKLQNKMKHQMHVKKIGSLICQYFEKHAKS